MIVQMNLAGEIGCPGSKELRNYGIKSGKQVSASFSLWAKTKLTLSCLRVTEGPRGDLCSGQQPPQGDAVALIGGQGRSKENIMVRVETSGGFQ